MPIVAGVNDRAIVAVHRGFVAMFAFLVFGLLRAVMVATFTSQVTFVTTTALVAFGLAAAAALTLEELVETALVLAVSVWRASLVAT